jgi:hypothetical protein
LIVSTMAVKSRPWMTFSTRRSFSSAMRGVGVPYRDRRGDIGHAGIVGAEFLQGESASAALFEASVSTSADASLVITSFRIAAMLLRLANHWRRILVSSLVASVLSSRMARVDQR